MIFFLSLNVKSVILSELIVLIYCVQDFQLSGEKENVKGFCYTDNIS